MLKSRTLKVGDIVRFKKSPMGFKVTKVTDTAFNMVWFGETTEGNLARDYDMDTAYLDKISLIQKYYQLCKELY